MFLIFIFRVVIRGFMTWGSSAQQRQHRNNMEITTIIFNRMEHGLEANNSNRAFNSLSYWWRRFSFLFCFSTLICRCCGWVLLAQSISQAMWMLLFRAFFFHSVSIVKRWFHFFLSSIFSEFRLLSSQVVLGICRFTLAIPFTSGALLHIHTNTQSPTWTWPRKSWMKSLFIPCAACICVSFHAKRTNYSQHRQWTCLNWIELLWLPFFFVVVVCSPAASDSVRARASARARAIHFSFSTRLVVALFVCLLVVVDFVYFLGSIIVSAPLNWIN